MRRDPPQRRLKITGGVDPLQVQPQPDDGLRDLGPNAHQHDSYPEQTACLDHAHQPLRNLTVDDRGAVISRIRWRAAERWSA
jgi:hypothetical protein